MYDAVRGKSDSKIGPCVSAIDVIVAASRVFRGSPTANAARRATGMWARARPIIDAHPRAKQTWVVFPGVRQKLTPVVNVVGAKLLIEYVLKTHLARGDQSTSDALARVRRHVCFAIASDLNRTCHCIKKEPVGLREAALRLVRGGGAPA